MLADKDVSWRKCPSSISWTLLFGVWQNTARGPKEFHEEIKICLTYRVTKFVCLFFVVLYFLEYLGSLLIMSRNSFYFIFGIWQDCLVNGSACRKASVSIRDTTQKDVDEQPCLERDSNPASQYPFHGASWKNSGVQILRRSNLSNTKSKWLIITPQFSS